MSRLSLPLEKLLRFSLVTNILQLVCRRAYVLTKLLAAKRVALVEFVLVVAKKPK